MAHPQASETGVVTVGRDPLAPRFDGDGGKVRVGDQVSLGLALFAEPPEDRPVARPRLDGDKGRGPTDTLDEAERPGEGGWDAEDPRVRHDPEETAEDERGDTEWLVPVYDLSQPLAEENVVLGFLAVRVDENVNVEELDGEPP